MAHMPPRPRTSPTRAHFFCQPRAHFSKRSPIAAERASRLSFSIVSITASAAGPDRGFAENLLGEERCDGLGRNGGLEGVSEMPRKIFGGCSCGVAIRISVRNAIDVAGKRLEAGFVRMRFAGERHGKKRAAVESVFKADDGGTLGIRAGDFDGVFDGFGAGVH